MANPAAATCDGKGRDKGSYAHLQDAKRVLKERRVVAPFEVPEREGRAGELKQRGRVEQRQRQRAPWDRLQRDEIAREDEHRDESGQNGGACGANILCDTAGDDAERTAYERH